MLEPPCGRTERPPTWGIQCHIGRGTTAVGMPLAVREAARGAKSLASLRKPGMITAALSARRLDAVCASASRPRAAPRCIIATVRQDSCPSTRALERETTCHTRESDLYNVHFDVLHTKYMAIAYGARHDPKRTPSSTARRPSSSIARTCSAPHSFICTTPAGEARRKKSSVREKVVRMRSSSR